MSMIVSLVAHYGGAIVMVFLMRRLSQHQDFTSITHRDIKFIVNAFFIVSTVVIVLGLIGPVTIEAIFDRD